MQLWAADSRRLLVTPDAAQARQQLVYICVSLLWCYCTIAARGVFGTHAIKRLLTACSRKCLLLLCLICQLFSSDACSPAGICTWLLCCQPGMWHTPWHGQHDSVPHCECVDWSSQCNLARRFLGVNVVLMSYNPSKLANTCT